MKPIILVGIGGTGSAVICNLFKKGLPPNLRVVMYDSDLKVKTNCSGFPDHLFCPTTSIVENATKFCRSCSDEKKSGEFAKKFREYWPGYLIDEEDKCAGLGSFSCEGLGLSRPKGFLGLLKNLRSESSIVNKIYSLYNELHEIGKRTGEIDITAGPDIYIISSFAGGTGSGTFIDLAFLLRQRFGSEIEHNIYGIFILGRAAMLERVSPEHISHTWACANTYAALWELRFWMRMERQFKKSYNEKFDLELKTKPYNAVILIDKENEAGKNLGHYQNYEQLVADFIYDLLVRDVSARRMSTVLDNIMGREGFELGSPGRGILLYPKRDIHRYLTLKIMRDYYSNEGIHENQKELEETLTTDKDTKFTFLDHYFGEIKDMKLERLGREINFPQRPPIQTKLKVINKDNYNEKISEILNSIKSYETEISNFLKNAIEKYTKMWKEEIIDHLKNGIQSKNIAFLHGYISRFLDELVTPEIEHLNEEQKGLDSKKNSSFQTLNEYIQALKETKGSPQWREEVLKGANAYCEATEERYIKAYALSFFKEIESYVKVIKDAVNFVQDFMKKEQLEKVRREITSYQYGYSTLYPFEASQIKVLELKANINYYDDIYKSIVPEPDKIGKNEVTKGCISAFEKKIADLIFNDVLPLFSVQKTIKSEDIYKRIIDESHEAFNEVFLHKIPDNIFEALFIEAKNKGIPFKDYLISIINNIQNDVAMPFLQEQKADATRTQRVLCIAANLAGLEKVINEHKEELGDSFVGVINKSEDGIIRANLIPGNETVDTTEFDDKIIVVNVKFGYECDNLSQFAEGEGSYYSCYKKVINDPDPRRRYEVFIDLRYNPRSLPATLLFLLCEYAGVIKKVIDKTGNETGVYKFGKDVLKKGIKGREKNINWFVNNEDPDKRKRILDEFKDSHWKKIPPEGRQKYFESVKDALKDAIKKVKDENLTNIYQANIRVMEQAIEAGYYNVEEITGII